VSSFSTTTTPSPSPPQQTLFLDNTINIAGKTVLLQYTFQNHYNAIAVKKKSINY